MERRKEVKSNTQTYTNIRRNAWIIMGFCPDCLERLDRFPNTMCSECKRIKRIKEQNR